MITYPKILTVWTRDEANHHKTLIGGQYACPEFALLRNERWEWTEKIDGTNIRIGFDGTRRRLAGRTDKADLPRPLYEALVTDDGLAPERLEQVFGGDPISVVMFGEGYGANIQRGGKYRDDQGLILFDVWIAPVELGGSAAVPQRRGVWLKRVDVEDIATKLGLPVVPVVGTGTLDEAVERVRGGHNGSIVAEQSREAEGLVMRAPIGLRDRQGKRIIAKVKRKDFAH